MKDGRYRIVTDYGAYEGMSWRTDPATNAPLEFDSADLAIQEALSSNSGHKIYIVRMVEPDIGDVSA